MTTATMERLETMAREMKGAGWGADADGVTQQLKALEAAGVPDLLSEVDELRAERDDARSAEREARHTTAVGNDRVRRAQQILAERL